MIVLFGPTASGKSDLALRLAEHHGGTVINADSMQLYRDLSVLSARPGGEAERRVPHRLYGVLEADQPGSVGDWLEQVDGELARARAERRLPVVVGGTGLYCRALLDGLAPVPPIPDEVRLEVRRLAQWGGPAALMRRLRQLDPADCVRLDDPQRLMRALEVVVATGRPLRVWQADPPRRLPLPEPIVRLALAPPRAPLAGRIERRLRAMIDDGALDEVRALRDRGIGRSNPVMKALAVPELLAHLDGALDLESALQRAAARTRRYAKRQVTWLRHRMADFEVVPGWGEALAADRPGAVRMAGSGRVAERA